MSIKPKLKVIHQQNTDQASKIDPDEFSKIMEGLGPYEACPKIAIAVSGGADSLTLTYLLSYWVKKKKGQIMALTFDHGLRDESFLEACQVHEWLEYEKIPHITLQDKKPDYQYKIQENARSRRYKALLEWCQKHQFTHLVTGHHQQDNFETFLQRLSHSSGLRGLTGISSIINLPQVRILRPLLSIPKERILLTLKSMQKKWIEDPSNHNIQFSRVRMRYVLEKLNQQGLTETYFKKIMNELDKANQRIENEAQNCLIKSVRLSPLGFVEVNRDDFLSYDESIQQRVMGQILCCIGGQYYFPKKKQIMCLLENICMRKNATLWGCQVLHRKKVLLIFRELDAIKEKKQVFKQDLQYIYWDKRFIIERENKGSVNNQNEDYFITLPSELKDDEWAQYKDQIDQIDQIVIPKPILFTLPVIKRLDGSFIIPHFKIRGCLTNSNHSINFNVRFRPMRPLSVIGANFNEMTLN